MYLLVTIKNLTGSVFYLKMGEIFYFFLVLIVNNKISLQMNLRNKCCQREINRLENGIFSCNNSSVPLNRLVIRISAVFLNNNESECVDSFDNKVFIFNKNNESFVQSEEVKLFPKCCPVGLFYDTNKRSCAKLINKTNIFNESVLKIGLPQCEIISDVILESKTEFVYNSTSLHLQKSDDIFSENQFCVDETVFGNYVARLCRNSSICNKVKCIKKCCVDGKSFVNGSHCQDTFVNGLEFNRLKSFVGELNGDFAIFHGYPGKIYIEPNVSLFFLDENGIFHNKNTQEIVFHPLQPYCIEHAQKSTINHHMYFGFLTMKSPPLAKKFLWNRVAMIISSGFIICTISYYIFAKETRKIFGKTLVSFCCSLLLLYFLLVYLTFRTNLHLSKTKILCKTIGFAIIYLGFCCFTWLQIMCFDITRTFGTTCRYLDKAEKQRRDCKKFLGYSLYGWGVPLLFTIVLVTFHLTRSLPQSIAIRMGNKKCGIEKGNYSEILFRAVPLTIVQIINSVLFLKTVIYVLHVKREIGKMVETASTLKKKRKFYARQQRFGLVVKLSFTMGILYLFEVISSFFDFNEYKETAVLEIIWDFINCLQGLFIFLIFVCKRKNYDRLKKSNAMERIRKISLTSRKTSLTTFATVNNNV